MAIIITDMDIPSSCMGCNFCNKGKVTDYGQFGDCILTNKKVNLMTWNTDADCPLKSADEMIAEIDKIAYTRILTTNPFAQGNPKIVGYDSLMKVIHKYCDEGDK